MGRSIDAQKNRIFGAAHARRLRTIDVLERDVFYPQFQRVFRLFERIDRARIARIASHPPVKEEAADLDMKEYRR